jgi:peptide deformylase
MWPVSPSRRIPADRRDAISAPIGSDPGRHVDRAGVAVPGRGAMLAYALKGGSGLVLEIVKYPHPALRYESRPVEEIDDALRSTIRAMFDLMYEARGIGLAANQVALPFRFFILNLTADPEKKDQEQVFINPEIVKRHSSFEGEEGCLSLPGLYANVRRARRIRVRAYDLDGNPIEHDAEDLLSRAVQHETDHLDGRLFIDYLDPPALRASEDKIREFERQYLQAQRSGAIPPDTELERRLSEMTRPPFLPHVEDEPGPPNGTGPNE